MEVEKTIEAKRSEAAALKARLENLSNALDKVKEKFPPLWSGSIKDLNKFVVDLEKWVKNPQVKRAKDLIENLKQSAKDTRSFAGLSEDYLVNSLALLEKASTLIGQIGNEQLKANMAKKILDIIQEEEDVTTTLNGLASYWAQFQEFEESKAENDFLKVVKDNLIASLVKGDAYSVVQITNAQKAIERARGALQLLSGTKVNVQAYVETYRNLGSADKVWDQADKIRNLLRRSFQELKESNEPFKEISVLLSQREQCMTKNALEEVYEAIRENDRHVDEWIKQAELTFQEEFKTIKTLVDFAGLNIKVDSFVADFLKNLELLNLSGCAEDYKKLQGVKSKATDVLESKISKNERKIIENMEKANELAEEMGEAFWESVRSLKGKQLIKIKVERSS